MAIGVFITFKILDFADLSVDGSICTGAAVATMLVLSGVNVYVAMLVAFLAGAAAGLVTGILHCGMGIPPILSGILTQLMLWSINLKILGQANRAINSRNYSVIVTQLDVGMSILALAIITAIIVAVLYWFFGMEAGTSIRVTGSNENMAKAQGINTAVTKIAALMLSNGIVAFAGALLAQYQGFADINMGRGAIVVGLAAVIIGNALFSKLCRNFAVKLLSVSIGGVIYYIVYQIVVALGFDTDLLKMLSAVVVAIFLSVPYITKKYIKKPKKEKKNVGAD